MGIHLLQTTARSYQVSAMPTFVLEYRGEVIAKVRGADSAALEAKINEVTLQVASTTKTGSETSLAPAGMVSPGIETKTRTRAGVKRSNVGKMSR